MNLRQGYLVKTRPLEYESPWRCDNIMCDLEVDTETVDTEVDKLEALSRGVDMGDVDQLEELLYRLGDGTILHPRHYIILEISHSLVFAYNSRKTLTRPQMDRKIQLCRHILSVSFANFCLRYSSSSLPGTNQSGRWFYSLEGENP